MPAPAEFQYLILRLVPSIDRGERVNVGIVVYCQAQEYLGSRTVVDQERLAALTPVLEAADVETHLAGLNAVAEGDPVAGVLASLTRSQRFGWLASPTSTVVQPSAVHTGLTTDPAVTLDDLFRKLVEL